MAGVQSSSSGSVRVVIVLCITQVLGWGAWWAGSPGRRICQALSPFVLAYVIGRWSGQVALEILIGVLLVAFACFAALRRPS